MEEIMNILDIGIDIVEIGRIKNALDSNGNFLKKLFTDKAFFILPISTISIKIGRAHV